MSIHDFTYDAYKEMLISLKERGFCFSKFEDIDRLISKGIPFILLRHDIDIDINAVLPLARIEAALGITATYFFMLRSMFYNPFSIESEKVIRELISLEHRISIHFDSSCYNDLIYENIKSHVIKEISLFKEQYNQEVNVISFHIPNKMIMNIDLSPIRHTYEDIYFKKIRYFADSGKEWRFGYPLDSEEFLMRKPFQLVIHPEWWNYKQEDIINRLNRYLKEDKNKKENHLGFTFKAYRRWLGCHV